MKKLVLFSFSALLSGSLAYASVTFTGSSINNAPGLTDGQTGVYLVSLDGTPFTGGALASIALGDDITASSTYGASFKVLGTNTVTTFGDTFLSSGVTVNYSSGIDQNDQFGVLVFDSSSTSALASDNYGIWTDAAWLLPVDSGGAFTFGSEFPQLSTAPNSTGTVVPEPSSFALLAGCFGLAWVMVRRRA